MKKILAVVCFSFLSLNFANAEILSLGVSGNVGMLEASGKESKLALIKVFTLTLKQGLYLLGITPPEKM